MICDLFFIICIIVGITIIIIKTLHIKYIDDATIEAVLILTSLITIMYMTIIGILISQNMSDYQTIIMLDENIKVYEKQRTDISIEIKFELSKYPEFEKEIFKNISPKNMSIYFVKYPELKSSETIMALSSELIKLQKTIFEQQINKNQVIKNIKHRNCNKFAYTIFMPRYKVEY